MKAKNIEIRNICDKNIEISANIEFESSHMSPTRIWYTFHEKHTDLIGNIGDIFLASLLLPAITLGEDLHIDGEVSEELITNSQTIQNIYKSWLKTTRTSTITVKTIKPPPPLKHKSKTACFFSGGVDSFYSLLKNIQKTTHIITVFGFDNATFNKNIAKNLTNQLQEVCAYTGKDPIEIKTNIRELTNPIISWGYMHGAILGGIGSLFSTEMNSITIPSSYSYAQLFPWGSHPLLDPLWSNNGTQIIHDGCEAGRIEKIKMIADHPIALKTLRVCWNSAKDNVYNCGKCEKCIRTMVSLYLCGALGKCSTLPAQISIADISKLRLKSTGSVYYAKENLKELSKLHDPTSTAIINALNGILFRARIRRAFRILINKQENW